MPWEIHWENALGAVAVGAVFAGCAALSECAAASPATAAVSAAASRSGHARQGGKQAAPCCRWKLVALDLDGTLLNYSVCHLPPLDPPRHGLSAHINMTLLARRCRGQMNDTQTRPPLLA
eukprot:SAG11_NODE_102_length_16709_cov_31.066093_19_plen_120_part_00